ncbi:alpha/beta fold hydrolase [Flavobacterium sp. XGLA_31]|uniref:alpha/beta fold hydrolase n=1 Tax=Flavobacterium sp. XGLA_31 TaxID=3447666 RepID=UPI003F2CBB61
MPTDLSEIAVHRIDHYPGRPTLIFLHDSLGCIALWRDFPEKLGEMTRCNVLIYDRQGYGKSCEFSTSERDNYYIEHEADMLNELLTAWRVEQAILFGHSDGGSIALIAAAKYPERILGILTEGAHIFVEDLTVNGIKDAIALYQTTDLKKKLEKYHGEKTEALFWAWAKTWTTASFSHWNIEHFLPAIHCPALIIQGESDEYGSMRQVEGILNKVQGRAATLMLPGIGHTPHKESPEAVLEQAATFILQITAHS